MAQLDPLGIMDADLDSCVPTDIITSSDKLGEQRQASIGLSSLVITFRCICDLSGTICGNTLVDWKQILNNKSFSSGGECHGWWIFYT